MSTPDKVWHAVKIVHENAKADILYFLYLSCSRDLITDVLQ